MTRISTGFTFSLFALFGLIAGMVFLSYIMILRRVEILPPDHPGSVAFASEQKFRFESEVKRFEDQMEKLSTSQSEAGGGPDIEQAKKQTLSDSMRWLNQSIDSLSEKLNQISKKLENTQDQALVEAEIKRAFREAFVGEVSADEAPEVSGDSKAFDQPILGEDVPEWIRQRVVERDRLLIPIESSLHGTLEECREELDTKLPQEVKNLIDEHVLKTVSADDIPGLTSEYIAKNLIDPAAKYDNYQERPSGNFHQMWVRLSIDKPKLEQIREWERQIITSVRVWLVGGLSLAFLGTFAGCSKVIRFLSSRETIRTQVRTQGRQTV
jgi:hypothetical protein